MSSHEAPLSVTMPPQHVAEYEQLCEHYRQGYRTLVEAAKLFLTFQAALAAALGVVLAHPQLQLRVVIMGASINAAMFIISMIGVISGFVALVIVRRSLLYYRVGIRRALELENTYSMRLMTTLHNEIALAEPRFTAVNAGRVLFLLIGLSWGYFLVASFL
jgi:hypothetical protein